MNWNAYGDTFNNVVRLAANCSLSGLDEYEVGWKLADILPSRNADVALVSLLNLPLFRRKFAG